MALVLLMIGLPIGVATAFVQEGVPGHDAAPDVSEPSGSMLVQMVRRLVEASMTLARNDYAGALEQYRVIRMLPACNNCSTDVIAIPGACRPCERRATGARGRLTDSSAVTHLPWNPVHIRRNSGVAHGACFDEDSNHGCLGVESDHAKRQLGKSYSRPSERLGTRRCQTMGRPPA